MEDHIFNSGKMRRANPTSFLHSLKNICWVLTVGQTLSQVVQKRPSSTEQRERERERLRERPVVKAPCRHSHSNVRREDAKADEWKERGINWTNRMRKCLSRWGNKMLSMYWPNNSWVFGYMWEKQEKNEIKAECTPGILTWMGTKRHSSEVYKSGIQLSTTVTGSHAGFSP